MNTHVMRLAIFVAIFLLLCAALKSEGKVELMNKVVIMIDGSDSYKARQLEAMERTMSLLDAMTSKKLRRWESDVDQITVVTQHL